MMEPPPEGTPPMVILACGTVILWSAAEVVSPHDASEDVNSRIQELFAAGVDRLWVVYPRARTVQDWSDSVSVRILHATDVLEGEPQLLPPCRLPSPGPRRRRGGSRCSFRRRARRRRCGPGRIRALMAVGWSGHATGSG
ncbi:MAG: hypothetical protein HY319_02975 [Armatimonadetes bacterium]|nr:hypothetical protein [Armatimonadota bacterium]